MGYRNQSRFSNRGLTEMVRIGNTWGAMTETFYGLSGLGDLLATCNSRSLIPSRVSAGSGKTLAEILAHLEGTAEGVNTTQVLIQRANQQRFLFRLRLKFIAYFRVKLHPTSA